MTFIAGSRRRSIVAPTPSPFFSLLLLLPALLLVGPSHAQQAGGTSSANPTVATQRALDANPPATRESPDLSTERTRPLPDTARVEERPANAATAGERIFIARIEVTGVTVLSPKVLRGVLRPYRGHRLSFADIKELLMKIREAYVARGYFLAQAYAPPQDLSDNVLDVIVSEARYGEVRVSGNRHYTADFIRSRLFPATAPGVIREGPLLKSLYLLNEQLDLQVRSRFEPGTEPGTADLVLQAQDDRPFHVTLDYNNFGIASAGRNRAGVGVDGGNVFRDGDLLTLHVTFPFPSESEPLYQASYGIPVGVRGNRIQVDAAQTTTRIGAPFQDLGLLGRVETYRLSFFRPLERTDALASNFLVGLSSVTSRNFVFSDVLLTHDEIRTLSASYQASTAKRSRRQFASATVTQGLGELLGGGVQPDAPFSRADTSNYFTKLNADLLQVHALTPKSELFLRGSAQLSSRPLPVVELFGIGGAGTVRGFSLLEYLGEEGYTASAELRLTVHQNQKKQRRLQLVTFVDHGHAELLRPQIGDRPSRSLTGAGFGARAHLSTDLNLALDLGFPVSTGRAADGETSTLYASMSNRF